MTAKPGNIDPLERARFDQLAASWWDTEGDSRPLHELNPARLRFISQRCAMNGAKVADIGCGGGILSEALAGLGAQVTGLDVAHRTLDVARLHLLESGVRVNYIESTAEDFAAGQPGQFGAITCMELLEHVPDPLSVVRACSLLLEPGGHCFLSTLNRTPQSFALAIVGAEHLLRLIPKGTHRYDRFIRPSELTAWLRRCGLEVQEICGLHYNPLTRTARLGSTLAVNYLVHATKIGASE